MAAAVEVGEQVHSLGGREGQDQICVLLPALVEAVEAVVITQAQEMRETMVVVVEARAAPTLEWAVMVLLV